MSNNPNPTEKAKTKPFAQVPVRSLNKKELIDWLESKHNFNKPPYQFNHEQLKEGIELLGSCNDGDWSWLDTDGSQYSETLDLLKKLDRPPQAVTFNFLVRLSISLLHLKWKLRSRNPMLEVVDPRLAGLLRWARSANDTTEFYTRFQRQKLPFFAIDELKPDRFSYSDDDPDSGDSFIYYGRKMFEQLARKGDMMNNTTRRKLHLHGGLGSGKSHILAAYALYLVAKGKRVIYIPDCRPLALNPLPAIQRALCLAFADDSLMTLRINNTGSERLLQRFLDEIADERIVVYFLVDQVNALDITDSKTDPISPKQKERTRNLLDLISTRHIKIQSVSGNHWQGHGDTFRDDSEESLAFYGGFEKEEMTEWWSTRGLGLEWRDELGESGRRYIEDLTGRLPSLLAEISSTTLGDYQIRDHPPKSLKYLPKGRERSELADSIDTSPHSISQPEKFTLSPKKNDADVLRLENKSSTNPLGKKNNVGNCESAPETKEIEMFRDDTAYEKLAWLADRVINSERAQRMKKMIYDFAFEFLSARNETDGTLDDYENTLASCLANGILEKKIAYPLLDHRFLYIAENNTGHVSGGLFVSSCYADLLRTAKPAAFTENLWYERLQPGLSPAELGFLVENICLSWIPLNGLAPVGIPKHCQSITFSEDQPPFNLHSSAFAVPSQFNYPFVDAIYWDYLGSKPATAETKIKERRPKIRIIGLRLRLQGSEKADSNAEAAFISKAREWTEQMNCDAEYGIVWLVERRNPEDPIQQTVDAETTEKAQLTEERDLPQRPVDAETTEIPHEKRDAPLETADSPLPKYTRWICEIREFAERAARGVAFAREEPFIPAPTIPTSMCEARLKRKRMEEITEAPTSDRAPEPTAPKPEPEIGGAVLDTQTRSLKTPLGPKNNLLKKQRTSSTRSTKQVTPPQPKEATSRRTRTASRRSAADVLQCLGTDGKSIEVVKKAQNSVELQGDELENGKTENDG